MYVKTVSAKFKMRLEPIEMRNPGALKNTGALDEISTIPKSPSQLRATDAQGVHASLRGSPTTQGAGPACRKRSGMNEKVVPE